MSGRLDELMASLRSRTDETVKERRDQQRNEIRGNVAKQKSNRAARAFGVEEEPKFDVFDKVREAAKIQNDIADLEKCFEQALGNDELRQDIRSTIERELKPELEAIQSLFPDVDLFDLLTRMEAARGSNNARRRFLEEMMKMGDLAEKVPQGEAARLIDQSKEAQTDEVLRARIEHESPEDLRWIEIVRVPTSDSNRECTAHYRMPWFDVRNEDEAARESEQKKRARAQLAWNGIRALRREEQDDRSAHERLINKLSGAASGKTTQDLFTGPVGTVVGLLNLTRENPYLFKGGKNPADPKKQKPDWPCFGRIFVRKVGEERGRPVCTIAGYGHSAKDGLKYVRLIEDGFLPLTEGAKEEKLFSFSAGFNDLRKENGDRIFPQAQALLVKARGPIAVESDEEDEDPEPTRAPVLEADVEGGAQ